MSEPEKSKDELDLAGSKEQVELTKKRKIFKELHDCFLGNDIYTATGQLGAVEGAIEGTFFELQNKTKIKEIGIKTEDEKIKYVLDVLKGCTASEAVTYCRAMKNAIDQHRYLKTKDLKVEELEIKLL